MRLWLLSGLQAGAQANSSAASSAAWRVGSPATKDGPHVEDSSLCRIREYPGCFSGCVVFFEVFWCMSTSSEVLRMLREITELSDKLSAQREALEVKLAEDKQSVDVVDEKLQTLPTAQPTLAVAGVVPTWLVSLSERIVRAQDHIQYRRRRRTWHMYIYICKYIYTCIQNHTCIHIERRSKGLRHVLHKKSSEASSSRWRQDGRSSSIARVFAGQAWRWHHTQWDWHRLVDLIELIDLLWGPDFKPLPMMSLYRSRVKKNYDQKDSLEYVNSVVDTWHHKISQIRYLMDT